MKIFIAGGTGFVGKHLVETLDKAGHSISALVRSPASAKKLPVKVETVAGDPMRPGAWQEAIPGHDAVINLTGNSIFSRWNKSSKQRIRDSRILSTRNIVDGLPEDSTGITLINASAAGFYGFCEDEEKFEDSSPGNDFLASVCVEWEKEAHRAEDKGARVVVSRFALVLGKDGGALAQMLPIFKSGLAGPLGSGRQWFPWIHISDLTEAIAFLLAHPDISGPVNLAAPHPVRNKEYARALGKALHRPAVIPVPGFALRIALGELATVLTEGCRMMPGVLNNAGFSFSFPTVESAFADLI